MPVLRNPQKSAIIRICPPRPVASLWRIACHETMYSDHHFVDRAGTPAWRGHGRIAQFDFLHLRTSLPRSERFVFTPNSAAACRKLSRSAAATTKRRWRSSIGNGSFPLGSRGRRHYLRPPTIERNRVSRNGPPRQHHPTPSNSATPSVPWPPCGRGP